MSSPRNAGLCAMFTCSSQRRGQSSVLSALPVVFLSRCFCSLLFCMSGKSERASGIHPCYSGPHDEYLKRARIFSRATGLALKNLSATSHAAMFTRCSAYMMYIEIITFVLASTVGFITSTLHDVPPFAIPAICQRPNEWIPLPSMAGLSTSLFLALKTILA